MADWRPMGQDREAAEALHEGVPNWMWSDLWRWIEKQTTVNQGGRPMRNASLVSRFDQLRRSQAPLAEQFYDRGIAVLQEEWYEETDILPFVDYLITRATDTARAELEYLLGVCGSAWTVGTRDGSPGLERRVPQGVQEAANQAMATPGHAGLRLSEAWHSVYGMNPNPTHAYAMAVKAVEDAAVPAVVPKQSGATLGHVIGRLKNDANWCLPLTREDPNAPTAETVLRMCQGLWKGQNDRHGGDASAPKSVSQDEAEAAVHMAVFLVQGFASGLIARR